MPGTAGPQGAGIVLAPWSRMRGRPGPYHCKPQPAPVHTFCCGRGHGPSAQPRSPAMITVVLQGVAAVTAHLQRLVQPRAHVLGEALYEEGNRIMGQSVQ